MPSTVEVKKALLTILETIAEDYDISFWIEADMPRDRYRIEVQLGSIRIERFVNGPHLASIIYDQGVAISFMEELEYTLDDLIRQSAESIDDEEPKDKSMDPNLFMLKDDAFARLVNIVMADYIEQKNAEF